MRPQKYLAKQTAAILDGTGRLGADPEAVHDTRVAIRRCRTMFALFGGDPVLDQALREYAAALGAVRDVEVLRALLAPAGPLVAASLERDQAFAEARLDQFLEGVDPLLARLAGGVPLDASNPRKAARRADRRAWRRLENAGGDTERLHRARKAVKRARYAAESVGAKKRAERHATVQHALGVHHDCMMAIDYLERVDPDPECADVLRERARTALADLVSVLAA